MVAQAQVARVAAVEVVELRVAAWYELLLVWVSDWASVGEEVGCAVAGAEAAVGVTVLLVILDVTLVVR